MVYIRRYHGGHLPDVPEGHIQYEASLCRYCGEFIIHDEDYFTCEPKLADICDGCFDSYEKGVLVSQVLRARAEMEDHLKGFLSN